MLSDSATLPLVPPPLSGDEVVTPVMVPVPVPGKVCPEAKVIVLENVSEPVKVLLALSETVPGKACPEAKVTALVNVFVPEKELLAVSCG